MKKEHETVHAQHQAMAKKHEQVTSGREELHKILANLMELMKNVK
ncbi:hypothetical protein Enr13x_57430 [Stieleria neptunia]|uniref:Uncharacterized protein n=1 Tax=Stieleria neptunia TaxID=2527979 RepID=A0A518HYB8_9BACT|nr:hypothetical protein [Stieleria neptunia]QDV45840.1 hypothetical protein Enr13x_57430 [Stieleria neptunia]